MFWHNVKCCLLVLNRVCLCVHIGVGAECERSYGAGDSQSPGRSCDCRDGHQHARTTFTDGIYKTHRYCTHELVKHE